MISVKEDMENHLTLARDAAIAAGETLKGLKERRISSENGRDIKLKADELSEEIIIDQYLMKNTGHDILSEERGLVRRGEDGYIWVVDPLDGSANFSRGMDDLCCISIALWKENTPILGVVYRFDKGDIYTGIVGGGAWKNDREIRTSGISQVNQSILATGLPVYRDYSDESLKIFVGDIQKFKKVRMLGSAALMGVLVAEGRADAYMEDSIMLWDVAASVAIAAAAGAVIKDIPFPKDTDFRCQCRIFANDRLYSEYYSLHTMKHK